MRVWSVPTKKISFTEETMTRNVSLAVNAQTDIGQVRDENEDSIRCYAHPDLPFSYIVIADGMGGYSGGALASRLAVESMTLAFSQLVTPTFLACTPDQQKLMIEASLRKAIHNANASIISAKDDNPNFAHMGTTLVVAVVWRQLLIVAHIGDSRAYFWSLRGLAQLTRDHSVVQEMIDSGAMTEDEARTSDVRNHITRALGVMNEVEPEISSFTLNESALILLCSDGLTEYFTNGQIEHVLATHRPALESCYRFIDQANQAGGKDNISVGVMECSVSRELPLRDLSVPVHASGEDTTVRRVLPESS